jgi:hypothetical protein
MIVDQQAKPAKEFYIREILDSLSSEFKFSELTKQQN